MVEFSSPVQEGLVSEVGTGLPMKTRNARTDQITLSQPRRNGENMIAKEVMQFLDDQIAKYSQAKILLATAMSLDLDPSAIAASVIQPPQLAPGSQPMVPMMPSLPAPAASTVQTPDTPVQSAGGRVITVEAREKMREAATKRWEKVRAKKAERARKRAELKAAQEKQKAAAAAAAPASRGKAQPAASKTAPKKTAKKKAETPELVGAK